MKQVTYSVLVRKTRAAINPNVLYTTKQAASFLNLSVSRLRDLRWQQKPPLFCKLSDKPNACVRYVGRDLLKYKEEHSNVTKQQ